MTTVRLAIFALTYALISIQQLPGLRVNRPAASLLGAVAMVTIGGLATHEAAAAVDLDVLVFVLGVLLLTAYLELGGFFEWAAAHVVRRAHSGRALLGAVVLTSGLLSALFVNDTICLVMTPLVIAAVRPLGVRPLPFLLALALASNAGSVMTITGNPQNMLIGIASGIHFARFAATMALPGLGALAIVYGVLVWRFRAELDGPFRSTIAIQSPPLDGPLTLKALAAFGGALACWLAGLPLPIVSIAAGAVLIAIARRDPAEAFARVEWSLLLFFAALFVVMRGVRDVPLIVSLTSTAASHLDGSPLRDATITSAALLVLSNLVSNVPAVMLWMPTVRALSDPSFIWLVVAMSATFAGNLTLLGSMANLIVAERAEARGVRLGFWEYVRVGVPVTLLTLVWGVLTLVLVRG